MNRKTLFRNLIAGLSASLMVTACASDSVTAPSAPAASASLLGNVLNPVLSAVFQVVPVVQRTQPLTRDLAATRTIGSAGGRIDLAEAGVSVIFDAGAVRQNTAITVTASAGSAVTYQFAPHGITFSAPVTIVQDMRLTNLANDASAASTISGGYTPNGLLDLVGGLLAKVTEILPAHVLTGGKGGQEILQSSFVIHHFSGYILTGGRQ